MPDLPNRDREEAALAMLLATLFADYRSTAIDLLGDPPDARRIPASFYSQMAAEVRAAVIDTLDRVHREAGQRMAEELGFEVSTAQLVADADAWSTARADELSADLADRVQSQVNDVLANARREQSDLAVVGLGLATVWSVDRAERIAASELTEAVSAGELDQRDEIEDRFNVTLVATWNVEDAAACGICLPLNGQPEEVWSAVSPSGPGVGAHPGCRCFLTFEIE